MHKIEVNSEDFRALCTQFGGASGWRRSNAKGSFSVIRVENDDDTRRKLKYGDITFIEKVDTEE